MRRVIVGVLTVVGVLSISFASPSLVTERGDFFPSRETSFKVEQTAGAEAGIGAPEPSVNLKTINPIFYDHPLMLKQYGYGVLSGVLAGALGFYIGNAFEGAIFGGRSHKGYLSFTGIRYEHNRGPAWGGGIGLVAGSSLAVFFAGDMDEEQGSVLWTVAGGALTSAAAFALADLAGVQEDRGLLAFAPLLALPPLGAVGGYQISRWFNDKKRQRVTAGEGSASLPQGPMLHAPRLGFAPGADGTMMRVDALNLTF